MQIIVQSVIFAKDQNSYIMKKRRVAFIPLIVASIIMLFYIAIPHHHHGEMICFIQTHCIQQEKTGNCGHIHNSNSCDKECEVRSLFQLDIIKQHQTDCNCCSHFTPDILFLPPFLLTEMLDDFHDDHISRKYIIPFQERLYPLFVNSTLAGRAPPVMV